MRRIAIAAAVVLPLAALAARAETIRVAEPQKGNFDTSLVDWGLKRGFFKAVGLDLDITYTAGGATNEQAVISGSDDLTVGTGLLGMISAYVKGAPVRVISAETTGVPDMYFYALAKSGIRSIRDAHGKTIAYSSPGSSSNLVTLALLKAYGVTDAKPIAAGTIAAVYTQVMSGQIDIGHAVPPYGLDDIKNGKIVVIAHGNDVPEIRNQTVRVNAVNLNFLNAHRDAVVRFMQAYTKSLDWAFSGDPKVIDDYAEGMRVSHELAEAAYKFYNREALDPFRISGLQRTLQDAYDFKRIPKQMMPDDVKGLFDIVWRPGAAQ